MKKKSWLSRFTYGCGQWVQLTLIALSLTGQLHWGWVWIMAPTWGFLALMIAFLIVALPIAIMIDRRREQSSAESSAEQALRDLAASLVKTAYGKDDGLPHYRRTF